MKVSFIIPMYGVAPYIERCARSLFDQTLESCEFIFVDDSSPDNCSSLLMELVTAEFPHLQNRITMIRNASNLGVSETRNIALRVAKGEFVIFVDGDDWVDSELAEDLLIEEIVNNADVVSSNFYRCRGEARSYANAPFIGGRIGSLHLLASQSFAIENRIWGLLIRRSLIVENEISFDPEITLGEDYLFLMKVLYHARNIAHIDAPLYCYRVDNAASSMNTISESHTKSYSMAIEKVEKFLTSREEASDFRTTTMLMGLNLRKWLLLRSSHRKSLSTFVLRLYMLVVNSIWYLRWRLFA